MDDSSTLKYGSYFAIGIGIIVFLLGLGAYTVSYTHLRAHETP